MIDHFGINVTDMERAGAFYDKVLGVLGHRRLMDFGIAVGYGTDKPDFWISTFEGVGPNREMHRAPGPRCRTCAVASRRGEPRPRRGRRATKWNVVPPAIVTGSRA